MCIKVASKTGDNGSICSILRGCRTKGSRRSHSRHAILFSETSDVLLIYAITLQGIAVPWRPESAAHHEAMLRSAMAAGARGGSSEMPSSAPLLLPPALRPLSASLAALRPEQLQTAFEAADAARTASGPETVHPLTRGRRDTPAAPAKPAAATDSSRLPWSGRPRSAAVPGPPVEAPAPPPVPAVVFSDWANPSLPALLPPPPPLAAAPGGVDRFWQGARQHLSREAGAGPPEEALQPGLRREPGGAGTTAATCVWITGAGSGNHIKDHVRNRFDAVRSRPPQQQQRR